MKGLMFNLLEKLARDAGCSQKAWDLVAEFAAAEAVLEACRDAGAPARMPPSHLLDVPIEAMVRCLAGEGSASDERVTEAPAAWDEFDLAAQADALQLETWDDSLPDRYEVMTAEGGLFQAGLSREAFAQPELLESWPPEREPDDEEPFEGAEPGGAGPPKH